MEKNAFLLYKNHAEIFQKLDDKQAGILIKAIFEYELTGVMPELDAILDMAITPIKQSMDRDKENYTKKVEKRRQAGAKGGKQRVANQANATFAKQNVANQANNDIDINNVSNNNNENNNDIKSTSLEEVDAGNKKAPASALKIEQTDTSDWYGEYCNVHLTKTQHQKLLSMVLDKKLLEAFINELSENIAAKKDKAKPYDEKYPDMHFIAVKSYWQYFKTHPNKFKTQKDVTGSNEHERHLLERMKKIDLERQNE